MKLVRDRRDEVAETSFHRTRELMKLTTKQVADQAKVPRESVLALDAGRSAPALDTYLVRRAFPQLGLSLDEEEAVLVRLDFLAMKSEETLLREFGLSSSAESASLSPALSFDKFRVLADAFTFDHPTSAIYATLFACEAAVLGQLSSAGLVERLPLPDPRDGFSNRYYISALGKSRAALEYYRLRAGSGVVKVVADRSYRI